MDGWMEGLSFRWAAGRPNPYEFIGFGAVDGPEPFKFIGFEAVDGPQTL